MGRTMYFKNKEISVLLRVIAEYEKDHKGNNIVSNSSTNGLLSASDKLDGVSRKYSNNCVWRKE